MRRLPLRAATVALAAVALAGPAPASAQLHLLMEGGLSTPVGSFAKVAGSGYLGRLGIELDLPRLPVAFRGEGEVDHYSSSTSTGHVMIVGGSASVVLSLPDIGVSPYVLAGIGEYSTEITDVTGSSSIGAGYHVGVGLHLGRSGFLEVRYVYAKGTNDYSTSYFPITVGLRL